VRAARRGPGPAEGEREAAGDVAGEAAPAGAAARVRAPSKRRIVRALAGTTAVVVVLRLGRDLLAPLALAVLVSYLLEPVVAVVVRRLRLARWLAAALVLLALIGALGAAGWAWSDDAAQLVARLPTATSKVRDAIRAWRSPHGPIASVQRLANEIDRTAQPPPAGGTVPHVRVVSPPVDVRALLVQGSVGVAALVGEVTLLAFLVYFLLASGDLFKRKLVALAGPDPRRRQLTLAVLGDIDRAVQRFLLIHVATSVFVGAGIWLVCRLAGLGEAPVWGIAAGVVNFVPYVGSTLIVGGVGLVAFVQSGRLTTGLLVAAGALAVQVVKGNLLTPKLVSRASRMNDVAVFTSLIVWGWLWGVLGLLLAVPLMMVLKAVCDRVEDLRPLGELLGD
jgi:predicted PurR-regulated permease PerM